MKIIFDLNLIEQLSIHRKPIGFDEKGMLTYSLEPSSTSYIVYDAHTSAPVGFGVKVGVASKTYIIQRNIDGRVLKIKVGNVSDFDSLVQARAKARQLIQEAIETKTNPNVERRKKKTLTHQAMEERLAELLESQMGKLRMRSEMAKLHDDTVVSNKIAAIYLNVSKSLLSEWRQTGVGPAYIKYNDKKAVNQLVHYRLGELRRFQMEMTR